ncbi:MAG: O-methyltransferase [Candidatus Promineifilaceae bacterium]|nr:O-methyltransferase [Candidatus Promineifilaceae bacterium]
MLNSPEVETYLSDLVPERPPEMLAMEAHARENNFPAIGPVVGYFCYQVARMIKARDVFELGSGYGYSTAWFAQAVRENGGGLVHHVVWDKALSRQARGHLERLGLSGWVQYHIGEAIQALSDSAGPYDLIFNDIDKQGYPASLPVIYEKLRPGGVMIIDNMLWYGRIFDEADRSASTTGIRVATKMLVEDARWVTTLMPIRDGVIIAYKK